MHVCVGEHKPGVVYVAASTAGDAIPPMGSSSAACTPRVWWRRATPPGPRRRRPPSTVQVSRDTSSPRCQAVRPAQRLWLVNNTSQPVCTRLANLDVTIPPQGAWTSDQSFGAYLTLGIHMLALSAYPGGGAEARTSSGVNCWIQYRTVRAETSTPRSASRLRTSAAESRSRRYQRTTVPITACIRRCPANGVAVRLVKVRRQAWQRQRRVSPTCPFASPEMRRSAGTAACALLRTAPVRQHREGSTLRLRGLSYHARPLRNER